jgi:hypothetical protein
MTARHQAFIDAVLVPDFDHVKEALGKGDPPHRLEYACQAPKSCTIRILEGGKAGYGEPELTLRFTISEHSSGQARLFTDSDREEQSTTVPSLSKLITSLSLSLGYPGLTPVRFGAWQTNAATPGQGWRRSSGSSQLGLRVDISQF